MRIKVPEICETCDYVDDGWESIGCARCTVNKNHFNRWKKHRAIVAAENGIVEEPEAATSDPHEI